MPSTPQPSFTLLTAFDLLRNKRPADLTAEEIVGLRACREANPSLFSSVGGSEAVERYLVEAEAALESGAGKTPPQAANPHHVAAEPALEPVRRARRSLEVVLYALFILMAAVGLYYFARQDEPPSTATKSKQDTGPADNSGTAPATQPTTKPAVSGTAQPLAEEADAPAEVPADPPSNPSSWLGWHIDQTKTDFPQRDEWDISDPANPVPAKTLRVVGSLLRLTRSMVIGPEDRWLMVDVRPASAAFPSGQIEIKVDGQQKAQASIGAGESDWPLYVPLEDSQSIKRNLEIVFTPGTPQQHIVFWNARLTSNPSRKPLPESPLIAHLRSEDPAERAQGAVAAAQAVDPLALTALLRTTEDEAPEVRRAAVMTLSKYNAGTPQFVVNALLKRLNDPDHEVRRLAVQSLLAFDCDRTWLALSKAMNGHSDSSLRVFLAQQLHNRNYPAVRDAYVKAISSEDDALRLAVIPFLSQRNDHNVTQLLVRAMDDPEPGVRQAAAHALAVRNDDAAEAALVAALASHPDVVVQRAAVSRFQRTATPQAIPAMRAAAASPDDQLRRSLPAALEKIPGPQATALLMQLFQAADLAVQHQAAEALSKRSDPQSKELMVKIFATSQDVTLRALSVRHLSSQPSVTPELLPALRDAAKSQSVTVRCEALKLILAIRAGVFQQKLQQRNSRPQAVDALSTSPMPEMLQLAAELLNDPIPRVRLAAAATIAGDPHPDADAPALRLLADPDVQIRQLAARRYPDVAIPSAKTMEFHKLCLQDSNAEVRAAAIAPLLQIRSRDALALLNPLIDDPEFAVRSAAQASRRRNPADVQEEALLPAAAKVPGPEGVSALIGLLQAPKASVRQAAAKALGPRTEPSAEEALCRAAKTHADLFVRRAAVRSLAAKAPAPAIQDALRHALRDSDAETRGLAVQALARVPDKDSIASIAPLVNDPIPGIRLAAVALLAQSPLPEAEEPLLAVLAHPDSQLRDQAIDRFQRIPSPRALSALTTAAAAAERETRASALRALGKLKDPEIVPALARALEDPDQHVRSTAAESLRASTEPEAARHVLSALATSPYIDVRIQAATRLGQLPDPAALEPLVAATRSEDDTLRMSSLVALGKLNEPAATAAICAALNDPVPEVRRSAANLLTARPDAIAEKGMLDALGSHSDIVVRRAAAARFQDYPTPQAIPTLAEAIKNVDDVLRLQAVRALQKTSVAEVIEPLIQALSDPSQAVRQTALAALTPRPEPKAQSAVAAYRQNTQGVQ